MICSVLKREANGYCDFVVVPSSTLSSKALWALSPFTFSRQLLLSLLGSNQTTTTYVFEQQLCVTPVVLIAAP